MNTTQKETYEMTQWVVEAFDTKRQEFTANLWNIEAANSEDQARQDAALVGLNPEMEGERPERCYEDACEECEQGTHMIGWRVREDVIATVELEEEPHLAGTIEAPYYVALASDEDGGSYEVRWAANPSKKSYDQTVYTVVEID